jgi:pyruvate dehydrogenase complex dehydrogenase (E1) component
MATLSALAREGKFDTQRAAQAVTEMGFDASSQDPVKL